VPRAHTAAGGREGPGGQAAGPALSLLAPGLQILEDRLTQCFRTEGVNAIDKCEQVRRRGAAPAGRIARVLRGAAIVLLPSGPARAPQRPLTHKPSSCAAADQALPGSCQGEPGCLQVHTCPPAWRPGRPPSMLVHQSAPRPLLPRFPPTPGCPALHRAMQVVQAGAQHSRKRNIGNVMAVGT
jgi:hypothetical protein